MTLSIRPVRPEDYEAIARAGSAAFPGVPYDAEELQEEDAENASPGLSFERWVAEVDGQVVGTACYFQSMARFHPQKFWMDAYVHPDFQRQGVGSALINQLMSALAKYNPISVRTFTREDIPQSVPYFEKRGFYVAKKTWKSAMDVTRFDFAPYAGIPEKVTARGIAIRTIADLKAEPGWDRKYLDLYNAIQTDVPDIDPAAAVSFDQFQKNRLESSRFLPDGQFIALDGEKWVGLCTLWSTSDPSTVDVGLTGVLPAYRRQSIAMALKLRSVEYAREHGYSRISTQNASTNVGMLAINDQMGFEREPAWVHLMKEF